MKLEVLIKRKCAALSSFWVSLLQVIVGSIFLGLLSQIALSLPFTPVPLSMQTLGVALLTLSLGWRKATLAVGAFLLQATAGLPVLAGGLSNPLWMIGPKAGYLIGFMLSAYIVGRMIEKRQNNSFIKNWLILSLNEGIILFSGALWLSLFVGWENTIALGVLPFLPGALIKITIAASSIKPIEWVKARC